MDSTAVSSFISSPLGNSIVTGFFTSLFASTFFYIMLWLLKPRISISPKIATFEDVVDGKRQTVYAFKIINNTWFYRVFDVKCELVLLHNVNTPGGTNVKSFEIKLIRDQIWFIKRRYSFNDQNALYAYLLGTVENLDEKWDDETKKLQFKIMCRHSMSGFSKVFEATYHTRSECIKRGKFKFGDTFEIV